MFVEPGGDKDMQNYNFACCFIWVADIVGGTQAEGFWELGAEGNILAYEERGNRRVQETT